MVNQNWNITIEKRSFVLEICPGFRITEKFSTEKKTRKTELENARNIVIREQMIFRLNLSLKLLRKSEKTGKEIGKKLRCSLSFLIGIQDIGEKILLRSTY